MEGRKKKKIKERIQENLPEWKDINLLIERAYEISIPYDENRSQHCMLENFGTLGQRLKLCISRKKSMSHKKDPKSE